MKQKILLKAEELFMQFGVKSITMDDLAGHLGISKKTLYQWVENKEDLVYQTVEQHIRQETQLIQEAAERGQNAIEEMGLLAEHVIQTMSKAHPGMLYDLQKYHPSAWQLFVNFKHNTVLRTMEENMNRGIKEGLYRSDLNPSIIARIYVGRLELILDPALFPRQQFPFIEVYKQQLKYHLRGIISNAGMELLDQQKLFKP